MICTRCRTVMGTTRREENPRSVLEWLECPACGRQELLATSAGHRAGRPAPGPMVPPPGPFATRALAPVAGGTAGQLRTLGGLSGAA
jgi:hypothetical protein